MTASEIAELKKEAEDWKTRWGASMPPGQSQALMTSVLKLIKHVECLEDMLSVCLERWREADYHWSLEFGKPSADRWENHIPDGPEFAAALGAIKLITARRDDV